MGDPGAGCGAFLASLGEFGRGEFKLLLALADLLFQKLDVIQQCGDFTIQRLVAMADIFQLARGEKIVGLGSGQQSLGIAQMLAGIAESDDGGFECPHRSFAHKRETVGGLAQGFNFAFQ